MLHNSQIIIRPLITEKSMGMTSMGRYVFEVQKTANKYQIKKAMKEVLNVDTIKINIVNVLGKKRRYGKTTGTTSNYKKAIVTIKSGQKIELFES